MGLKTVEQLRQARAALGWMQKDIAEASGVSLPTIKRLEKGEGVLGVRLDTLQSLEKAFVNAGVQFLEGGEVAAGMGVALRSEDE